MKSRDTSASALLKVGIYAGMIGGIGWMAKMVIMTAQGGPDSSSTSEAFAFFAGLLGVFVATAVFGAYTTRARSRTRQVLSGLGAVVVVAVVIAVGQAGVPAVFGEGWVQEEAVLGIVGAVYAIGAIRTLLTHTGHGSPVTH